MNPLLSALSQWAEAFANGGLALDPEARRRLEQLDGRSIQFDTGPDESLTVEFCGDKLRVMARRIEQPSAIVSGSPASLLGAGLGAQVTSAADLRVTGDEVLVEEFRKVFKHLRPDLSEPLARTVGKQNADTLAGFIDLGARALGRLADDLSTQGSRVVGAAAQRQFVDADSLDRFSAEVFDTQMAIDRLAARVALLDAPPEGSP